MSKLAPTSIKYIIRASINAKGVIEKPDVIGAIFGQTEGLLGADLDLRELQRTGRIGRIDVNIKSEKGESYGEIIIPSALDSAETALIAATLETIERVGPCNAKITLKSVEDTREIKRRYVIEKAKQILKDLLEKGMPDTARISEELKESIREGEITSYQGLPCGPDVLDSDEIIVVEGRADVINLLRYGIKNAIAMEGSSVPKPIIELSKEKIVTAFFDGDRGGSLNLKSLMNVADVDYVALAPEGKEVEELTKKEIFKALRDRVSAEQFKSEKERVANNVTKRGKRVVKRRHVKLTEEQRNLFKKTLDELMGTRAACIFDPEYNLLGKVPIKELSTVLMTLENPFAVVLDGKVDYKLNWIAKKKGIKYLIGTSKEDIITTVNIITRDEIEGRDQK